MERLIYIVRKDLSRLASLCEFCDHTWP